MKSRMQWTLSVIVLFVTFAGSAVLVSVSYKSVLRELKYQIAHDNKTIVNTITKCLARYMLSELPRPRQIHLIQNICNEVIIPNKGFARAVDGDGKIIAMPGLELESTININDGYFSKLNSFQKHRYQDFSDKDAFEGMFYKGDTVDIITMSLIEDTDIRLFVHQDFYELKSRAKRCVYPLVIIGVVALFPIGFVSYILAGSIIKKYENRLEMVNVDLDQINKHLSKANSERRLYFEGIYNSKHGIAITDTDGKIVFANPAFEELYGFSLNEIKGKNALFFNPDRSVYSDLGISEEEYDVFFKGLWDSISNPETACWEGELPNKTKEGSLIWVRLIINAVFDTKGNIVNYIWFPLDVTERRKDETNICMEVYRTIADIAEARDNESEKHVIRVGMYSRRIAEHTGMSKKYCEDIEIFSALHDIGKVGIPDMILLDKKKLTKKKYETMKTHTLLGYEMLKEKPMMEMAAGITYMHHEKFDGTGYPQGLAGENIPLYARIVALADAYDALRCNRPYKQAWTHEDAVKEIAACSGTHFDPDIVNAFLEIEHIFAEIAEEYKDEYHL
ncbi:MAG: HD domain-containing protein [Candidatus Kuenenia sp.]|nr:HD domain-containing protein [Candidatus Kuenenia hertensis]